MFNLSLLVHGQVGIGLTAVVVIHANQSGWILHLTCLMRVMICIEGDIKIE
jgi:hypothetical protein